MSSAPSAYGSRHTTVMRCPWAAMLWLAAGASCQSTSTCVRPRGMGLDDCNALHPQRASSVLRSSACGAPIFARSASLYAGVGRADLLADALVAELPNSRDAHVRCCSWQTYRHW